MIRQRVKANLDGVIALLLLSLSLALYVRTLAPSVVTIFDDSLEFQLVTYRLGIAHPTGYPLYTLLGKLFTLLPIGDVAYRVNFMTAVWGATTVALLYLAMTQIIARAPAILAALTLAASPVFWSQAVVAEVYTLHSLFLALLLFLLLHWQKRRHGLPLVAMVYGLSLTHHRTTLLALPAILLFIWVVDREALRPSRALVRTIACLLLPLLIYLYIPWRGIYTSSLDGTYVNTLSGFLTHITAGGYSIFLTENPFQETKGLAFYLNLFREQFTLAGLGLTALGFLWLWRRPKPSLLLGLVALANLIFALAYRVPDVQVYLIPAFLLGAIWMGGGLDAIWHTISIAGRHFSSRHLPIVGYSLLLLAGILIPWTLLRGNYNTIDLSRRWEVHDYGVDMLSQPLENDAVVVGILGEMTLLRYFQETEGLRPDIITIAADKEEERLKTVEEQLEAGQAVYLTRRLPGADRKWHLWALGPLIRVSQEPIYHTELSSSTLNLEIPFGESIHLLGYQAVLLESHAPRTLRLTLYWKALHVMDEDLSISARLKDSLGHIGGQLDRGPVQDAYPTSAWSEGEIVVDSYDVPILPGIPPGTYDIEVIVYHPETMAEVGQATLGQIEVPPLLEMPAASRLGVGKVIPTNFGNSIQLLGYAFTSQELKPGDSSPLTFLWREMQTEAQAPSQPSLEYDLQIWLEDDAKKTWGEREYPLGGHYPIQIWKPGQLVRQWEEELLPANLPDGEYKVLMQITRGERALPRMYWLIPYGTTLDLGRVLVKGRQRVFTIPSVRYKLDFALDEKVRLLGYDLEPQIIHPGDTINLTLYWQTIAEMETSYTVFVHLLDANNSICAQGDSLPAQGSLPTTGWVAGEVIKDQHQIAIPADASPGEYTLFIGMYDPKSGARLPAYDTKGEGIDDEITIGTIRVVH